MSTIIGYARVSTIDQHPELQIDALRAAGAEKIFTDHASGASMARPELTACLEYLRPGDTLAVWRLDRLGRSVRELIEKAEELRQRGVQFRSLTEQIDTSTPAGAMIFHMIAAVAQMERDLLRERTLAGLAAARARGRTGGRPTVMTAERTAAAARMRESGDSFEAIARVLGVSRNAVRRALQAA